MQIKQTLLFNGEKGTLSKDDDNGSENAGK